MFQIDPTVIWSIGGSHPYDLQLIDIKRDDKYLLGEYNKKCLEILREMETLLIQSFLTHHYNRDACDKDLFIDNLIIHIAEARYDIDGSKFYLLDDEKRIAINIWLDKKDRPIALNSRNPDNKNLDILVKLSEDEKERRRKWISLDQETLSILIYIKKKLKLIADIPDMHLGILYEHITRFSRNTIGKGISKSKIEAIINKDVQLGDIKTNKLIKVLENEIYTIKELRKQAKKSYKPLTFRYL